MKSSPTSQFIKKKATALILSVGYSLPKSGRCLLNLRFLPTLKFCNSMMLASQLTSLILSFSSWEMDMIKKTTLNCCEK